MCFDDAEVIKRPFSDLARSVREQVEVLLMDVLQPAIYNAEKVHHFPSRFLGELRDQKHEVEDEGEQAVIDHFLGQRSQEREDVSG
jgi:hypothetical protein